MTLKSMTAFGAATIEQNDLTVTAEIKTLNSRFIEVNVRMPRSYAEAEPKIVKLVKSKLHRGKVDITLDIRHQGDTSNLPSFDPEAASHYLKIESQVKNSNPDADVKSLSTYELMKLEGVLTSKKKSANCDEKELDLILKAVEASLDKVIETRVHEGESLKPAFEELITSIESDRQKIIAALPEVRDLIENFYQKKLQRVVDDLSDKGFKADMPPQERIMGELALLVDKADIEEEITRLDAHCKAFNEYLNIGETMGRKLDFLCQELHREVNTISSKLHQSSVAGIVLDMKQNVEKIRQQVQNIE